MGVYASLPDFKAYLNLKPDTRVTDELLLALLDGACAAVDAWLGRSLLAEDYDEQYNGNGSNRLVLRNWPVRQIDAVVINGRPVTAQAHYGGYGWRNDDWLLMLGEGEVFPRGMRNVRVQYRAGLEDVPPDVAGAIYQIAATRFKEREWTGYASKALAGEVISFHSYGATSGQSLSNGGIPPSALAVLNRYKRVVPA